MKAYSGGGLDASTEEAGVALVGVHSEYPRFGEERALGGGTYKGGGAAKHKPNIGYRLVKIKLIVLDQHNTAIRYHQLWSPNLFQTTSTNEHRLHTCLST